MAILSHNLNHDGRTNNAGNEQLQLMFFLPLVLSSADETAVIQTDQIFVTTQSRTYEHIACTTITIRTVFITTRVIIITLTSIRQTWLAQINVYSSECTQVSSLLSSYCFSLSPLSAFFCLIWHYHLKLPATADIQNTDLSFQCLLNSNKAQGMQLEWRIVATHPILYIPNKALS